ncbi:MAG: DUF444 family protein [Desulfobacterales bacterium]|nr:DUF444 family protein [Desulfobacterales bacterium]MDJ0914443.1 DUF444 family protein [Desulfobacterales bacterium]
MKTDLYKRFKELKQRGLSPEREAKMRQEMASPSTHSIDPLAGMSAAGCYRRALMGLYDTSDLMMLQNMAETPRSYVSRIRSIDELLERDRQREKDGFPRKIRVGRLIKPGKGGKEKIVVVPTTVEEKFVHDPSFKSKQEGDSQGGAGDGEEGEVIGEQPVRPDQSQPGSGPGEGDDGQHDLESSAYDLGKILTEKFELPNLKDKGKKRSLTRYTYDLTDKNRGFGQVLDKKATLRKIVETNISLGRIPDVAQIDPTQFLITPDDKIYRILSREKDYESQAMVFFLRDYSGSMMGKSTELVVAQHVLIYSWLLYQYARQVETRFILHDTEAKEVPDFYTYYNSTVAGGTQVSSAYKLVNEIVSQENLVQDYNIYIFHGTDGDDWDTDGKQSLPELEKMLNYANRVGISIAEHASAKSGNTEVQRYLKKSKLLETKAKLLRLDVMSEDADEPRLIEGIKTLISE